MNVLFRIVFLIIIALVFIFISVNRNSIYKTEVSLWSDVVQRSPENPRALYNLAHGLHAQNRFEEAIYYLKRIIDLKKHNWFVLNELGAIFSKMGLYNDALNWHRKALELMPDSPDVWAFIGMTHIKMGDNQKAITAFEAALNIIKAKGSPDTLYYYPGLYQKEGYALSSSEYKKVIYYYLGNLYRSDEPEKAMKYYEDALRLDPYFFEVIIDLANLYDDIGRYDEALSLYQRAVIKYPKAPEAYYNLGVFYERRGDITSAVMNYNKALSLKSDYIEPKERLRIIEDQTILR